MKKGFTLVELLVVIAIIGVLAAAVLVSLAGTRPKARDARRRSDLQSVSKAILLYADANTVAEDGVPWTSDDSGIATIAAANLNYETDLVLLVPTYLQTLPADPSDGLSGFAGYGYVTLTSAGTALAATNAAAVRFRLGAETEDPAADYNIWSFPAATTGIVVSQ